MEKKITSLIIGIIVAIVCGFLGGDKTEIFIAFIVGNMFGLTLYI